MYKRTNQALLLSLVFALIPATAFSVTINVAPHPEFGNEMLGFESPAYDPNGDKLQAIMEAAALYWGDIIRDPHVINVHYFYKDTNGSFLGWACYPNVTETQCAGDLEAIPNQGWIAIDSDREWFFDPTPYNHSEFDMQQTLARDLTPAELTEYFSGLVPELLEVTYHGDALPSAPEADTPNIDMFSVVLHEMGHLLGMANAINGDEVTDDVYDFDPVFVDQAAIGARVNVVEGDDHLQAVNSLMEPMGSGQRKLPTATDVFAISAVPGWSDIHLPRREFWGGMAYHVDDHWSGDSIPDGSDDVWVRWGGSSGLNHDTDAQNLVISDDSTLFTLGKTLQVVGYTTIEPGNGTEATLDVNSDVISSGVRIGDGGLLALYEGQVLAWVIDNESGGTLVSEGGTNSVTAGAIDNDGTLAKSGYGQLIVDTFPNLIDLDGPGESGEVSSTGGDLVIQDELSDPFDGVMTVGVGGTIDLVEPWTLASGGQLVLAGGLGGDQARIQGGDIVLQGAVDVSGHGRISPPVRIEPGATVTVAADSELQLQWLTELVGGTYTGPGTIRLSGPTTVILPTTMAPAVVDLDGASGNTQIDLNRSLTLEVDRIDLFDNVFSGTVNVQNWLSSLRVFLTDPQDAWEIDGVLDLSAHPIWSTIQLDGNDVIIDGSLNVDGVPWLNANIDLRGTLSTADADARAYLNSGGVNVFRDTATVAGQGRVGVRNGTELQLENGFDEPLRLENAGTVMAGVETGNPIGMPQILLYTQSATGALELEIGGLTAGVDHDRLQTIGDAELAGTLRVELANGFVPQLGDSFYLVVAGGSVIGAWDAMELPPLTDPGTQWNLIYGADSVLLDVGKAQ